MKSVKAVWKALQLSLMVVACLFVLVLFFCLSIYFQIPTAKEIRGCMTTQLYKVNLCPGSNTYVKLNNIAPSLRKAVLVTEDSAFYEHNGFDLKELKNSLETNLEKGRFARGGSTITQQLVKNLFLSKEKTLQRKFMEALITLRVERVLSKNEILERYLNVVQFGKDMFGVKAAARAYFNKSASELTVAESAFLAMLLPNPEAYSKSFHMKKLTPFADKRLNQIVDRLYAFHKIDVEEYDRAKSQLNYFFGVPPAPEDELDESLLQINEEEAPTTDDYL